MIDRKVMFRRMAVAGFAFAAVTAVACAPAEYEVPLGARVELEASPAELPEGRALAEALRTRFEPEDVEIAVRRIRTAEGERMTFVADIWSDRLGSVEEIAAALREEFPAVAALPEGALRVQPLEAKVRGTVAEKLGHDLFAFRITAKDAEEARRQVLEQLAERGLEGDVDVRFERSEDGRERKEIRVRVGNPAHGIDEAPEDPRPDPTAH